MNLNFKTYGSGQPLIILHGLFGMLDNWKSIATKLADQYMIYLVDLRNHGRSPHADEHTYELMADDLKFWMEDQWLYEANMLGHSMGGKAAMQFAHNFPEMLEKLIVVDIAPKQYSGGHEMIIDALSSIPIDNITSRKEVESILSQSIDDHGVILFLMKNLTRNKTGGFQWKMNLPVLKSAYEEHIMGGNTLNDVIEVPTLFIKGGNSQYISEEDNSRIDSLFNNADIHTIDDAGHWVHADKPLELIQKITEFLS